MRERLAWFLLVLLSVLFGGLAGCTTPTSTECVRTSDCTPPEICVLGACAAECVDARDCTGAEECVEGMCITRDGGLVGDAGADAFTPPDSPVDAFTPCGGPDEPCCTSAPACRFGVCSPDGTCGFSDCAAPGEACDTLMRLCCDGVCATGLCRSCGMDSEPCCPGGVCAPGLRCDPALGACQSCGFNDEPCCTEGLPCNMGLSCTAGICL